jgi:hypothetical protein
MKPLQTLELLPLDPRTRPAATTSSELQTLLGSLVQPRQLGDAHKCPELALNKQKGWGIFHSHSLVIPACHFGQPAQNTQDRGHPST